MNNEIYERLLNLFLQLGENEEDKSVQKAELLGYCAGLKAAQSKAEGIFANFFIDTADKKGISMLLSAVGEAVGETEEESKEKIISAFSHGKALITLDEFENAVKAVKSTADYEIENGRFILHSRISWSRTLFEKVSLFFKNFVPPCFKFELGEYGVAWELWDKMDFHWYEIDGMQLPFSALETI